MNRIDKLFQEKGSRILSIYYPAGYPNLADTLPVLQALQAAGIDMAEVGIPFSDPMADGPVIQEASTRALRNGMSLRLLFRQLAAMRDTVRIPVILMGYLNPIMQYGFGNFCESCEAAGVDGVIIPDLPFDDYLQDYKPVADKHGLHMVMLITPETSEERVRAIDAHTGGFVYMVSSAATTGAQKSFDGQKQAYFRRVGAMGLRNPRLVGFGVSNRATLEAAFANSQGAIIGSRFVQLLAEKGLAAPAFLKVVLEK